MKVKQREKNIRLKEIIHKGPEVRKYNEERN
jgi:hypothetical protein